MVTTQNFVVVAGYQKGTPPQEVCLQSPWYCVDELIAPQVPGDIQPAYGPVVGPFLPLLWDLDERGAKVFSTSGDTGNLCVVYLALTVYAHNHHIRCCFPL